MKKIYFLFAYSLINFMSAQDNLNIKVYQEKVDDKFIIYVDNQEYAPISIEYSYKAQNLSSTLANNSILVIPPRSSKNILSELKRIENGATKFNYDVYYVLGDVKEKNINSNYIYQLPFPKGKTYTIYQGYDGKFSHQGTASLDFSHKEGDKVMASRGGKVVIADAKNNQHCITIDCAKYNNRIVILHDDGSLGEYVHLKQNGIVIQLGDQIQQGQLIAYSGNTGWSKGPHLHFSVYTNNIDGSRNYIKTKFKTSTSDAEYLKEHQSYLKNYD